MKFSLKCKKFHKIDKCGMCQSCGNPWNLGDYKMKMRKTYKATTIKKIKQRNSKVIAATGDIKKHILKRYNKNQSSILIQCLMCKKSTKIPTPLPLKIVKEKKVDTLPEPPSTQNIQNQPKKKKKKVKQNMSGLKIPQNPNPNFKNHSTNTDTSMKKTAEVKSIPNTSKKVTATQKSTFSKAQMKNIAKSLKQVQPPKSSLQAFLSSVR